MAYISVIDYKRKSLLPGNIIDEVEARSAGFVAEQLELVSAHVGARLAKRYPLFKPPYATILGEWVAAITDLRVYMKRGVSSLDETWQLYKERHDTALKEAEEAANSEVGLFEIPATSDPDAAGAVKHGTPYVYSEASPYVSMDRQGEVGRNEDSNRTGSGG